MPAANKKPGQQLRPGFDGVRDLLRWLFRDFFTGIVLIVNELLRLGSRNRIWQPPLFQFAVKSPPGFLDVT